MAKSNYCLLNPQGGAITVQLTVNNGLRTGAVFILWELQNKKWAKKEKFRLTTGDNGIASFTLTEAPANIENDSLAWSINTCATIPSVSKGDFTITIIQDGIKRWKKKASRLVPNCSEGKHLTFGSHIIFKHLIEEQFITADLWKDTE